MIINVGLVTYRFTRRSGEAAAPLLRLNSKPYLDHALSVDAPEAGCGEDDLWLGVPI